MGSILKSARSLRLAGWSLALCLLLPALAVAQLRPLPQDEGVTGLGLALRRLPVSGSVLYITAHPDDENNGVLVKLRRQLGLRTGLLTLTRGEGGQNEIGPELNEALGVLRTEELAAVHLYDGAEQYFSRAYEFGYSFSVEETFLKWGREEILADTVRVIRGFRPDVILTLPLEAAGGGQHHQAAARLAVEAFRAAADPRRFPEQMAEGLRPWQARKVYRGGVGGANEAALDKAPTVVVDTSNYDPLLGMSAHQFGALARRNHRCQGAGQLRANPGVGQGFFTLVDSEPAATSDPDLLAGIDTSLGGLSRFVSAPSAGWRAALAAVTVEAEKAQEAYDSRRPEATLAPVLAGLAAVRRLQGLIAEELLPEPARAELRQRLAIKEGDFTAAAVLAQGVVLEGVTEDDDVVPGQSFQVTARLFNQGAAPVRVVGISVDVPAGWTVTGAGASAGEAPLPSELAGGAKLERTFRVTVAADAPATQPYWKRPGRADRYALPRPEHQTLPWTPPEVVVRARYESLGVPIAVERPAWWRYEGRWVGGEKQKVVNVVPALSVTLAPEMAVVSLDGPRTRREFRATVRNDAKGASSAVLRLLVPASWVVEPREAPLAFGFEGEEITTRFFVTPDAALVAGEARVRAVVRQGIREYREGYQVISYDHIQERHLFREAVATVKVLDVKTAAGASIGYVQGTGDHVPVAVEQLGLPLTFLSPDDVAYGDLSRFTTIVTGVRAYQTRKDLRASHQRLMEFVERGGHLVVQYNKFDFNAVAERPNAEGFTGSRPSDALSPFVPYPAAVTSNRVTLEDAPLEVLVPAHSVFNTPNRIGPDDWAGWIQERGLYFLGARDERYTELLASADPFPKNPGRKTGLLTEARVGKGTWTYVGLGLWRQLPAGIPGAYRLLANLLSRPRAQ